MLNLPVGRKYYKEIFHFYFFHCSKAHSSNYLIIIKKKNEHEKNFLHDHCAGRVAFCSGPKRLRQNESAERGCSNSRENKSQAITNRKNCNGSRSANDRKQRRPFIE